MAVDSVLTDFGIDLIESPPATLSTRVGQDVAVEFCVQV